MRPDNLDEFVGQKHLLSEGKILRKLIEEDKITSLIFWGPPGVGKTTLASIIANKTHSKFINFSAVTSGIKEIKAVMSEAEHLRKLGERTNVFIDEIHRYSKTQQDALLKHIEAGTLHITASTTENLSSQDIHALFTSVQIIMINDIDNESNIRII